MYLFSPKREPLPLITRAPRTLPAHHHCPTWQASQRCPSPFHLPLSQAPKEGYRSTVIIISTSCTSPIRRDNTYTMRGFTAALQPDTCILTNALLCKVDLVVPLHLPLGTLQLSTRHQVSRVLEQRLVQISAIACCYKDGIDVQCLLPLLAARTLGEI